MMSALGAWLDLRVVRVSLMRNYIRTLYDVIVWWQMANNARVLGIVLMHATGTSAGVFEMLKDKVFVTPPSSRSVSSFYRCLPEPQGPQGDTELDFLSPQVCLGGLVISALVMRTRRPRFESRVAPLFHWVATLGKLFTHIASPVS